MESSEFESSKSHGVAGIGRDTGLIPSQRDSHRSNAQVWAIALAAGVAAGLVSWLAGESVREAFKPQLFEITIAFTKYIQPTAASLNTADLKNATLVFTVLGAVAGLIMGIAGGVAGRSLSRGLIVGLGGVVTGGLVGALASVGLLPFFYRRTVPDPNDLLTPILIHGGIWMAVGAVGGLAFAIGMRRERRGLQAIVGACLGAVLATLTYHGLSEAFFAETASTLPVATATFPRLLAVFLVTVFSACGAARGILIRRAS